MWDGLTGSAYHDNGRKSFDGLTKNAYHEKGRKAFDNLTKRANDKNGGFTGAKSFSLSVGLGTGINENHSYH